MAWLKLFVNADLKVSGRRSFATNNGDLHTIKADGVAISFYPSTKTLNVQGSKSDIIDKKQLKIEKTSGAEGQIHIPTLTIPTNFDRQGKRRSEQRPTIGVFKANRHRNPREANNMLNLDAKLANFVPRSLRSEFQIIPPNRGHPRKTVFWPKTGIQNIGYKTLKGVMIPWNRKQKLSMTKIKVW